MSETTREQDLSGVTLLGNQNTKYKFDYDPSILERFEKKFEDSNEDEQIVSLDCFEFASRCISGDTLIDVATNELEHPSGVPIKDLVGTSGYVFGFDPETENTVARKYKDVRCTGKSVPVVKVTMSVFRVTPERHWETSEITCTPDHQFLVRTQWHKYEWVKASDLKEGMHLVYGHRSQDRIREASRHRAIMEGVLGHELHSDMDVHHIDHNHYNNSPDNLECISKHDHYHHHRSVEYGYDDLFDDAMIEDLVERYESGENVHMLAQEYGCDFGTIADRIKDKVSHWRSQGESLQMAQDLIHRERDDEICRLYVAGYLISEISDYLDLHGTRISEILKRNGVPIMESNRNRYRRKSLDLPPLNHKVVSVEPAGTCDVYNMEVEDIHNFFANEVCIHNCPKTGQPDFATIYISYIPNKYMVESKSLKLYLFSYQQHGDFHESCVHMIMQDLVDLLDPKYLEVYGDFNSRGGISILPFSVYADEDHTDIKKARQLAMMQHSVKHHPRTC